jgi:hypothetical protein
MFVVRKVHCDSGSEFDRLTVDVVGLETPLPYSVGYGFDELSIASVDDELSNQAISAHYNVHTIPGRGRSLLQSRPWRGGLPSIP